VYTDVSVSRPIGFDLVVFLEDGHEMFHVFFSDVFYAKIVNNKCERYWSCCVLPLSGHQFALEISVFVEALFK